MAMLPSNHIISLTSLFCLACVVIPSVLLFGRLLDWTRWSQKSRAWMSFAAWTIPQIACFIWIGVEYHEFGSEKAALDYKL
jgi:hypothetical protein